MVLSHTLWQRRFGSDPAVLGQTVVIERRPMRVIGVMPRGFTLPAAEAQLFLPWGLSERPPRDQHYVVGVARLASGTGLRQGEAELRAIASALAREHPQTNEGWSVRLVPLRDDVVGDTRATLLVLLLAVALRAGGGVRQRRALVARARARAPARGGAAPGAGRVARSGSCASSCSSRSWCRAAAARSACCSQRPAWRSSGRRARPCRGSTR